MASRSNQDVPPFSAHPRRGGKWKERGAPVWKMAWTGASSGRRSRSSPPRRQSGWRRHPPRPAFPGCPCPRPRRGLPVGGIRLQAFGELPRGVEPAPFVRHAGGTRAGPPPRAGMASGCGGVRRVYPDAVLVRPVADVPGRAPPGHGSISPAGFQGFTAGDGRSGRQDFRRAGNTGPQAGGEGEQRQGVGHGLHV